MFPTIRLALLLQQGCTMLVQLARGQLQQDADPLCMPYRAILASCAICPPLRRR